MLFQKSLLGLSALAVGSAVAQTVNQTTCNGQSYTYQQLAGYGYVPSDAIDQYNDTLGGYGSAIAIPRSGWKNNGANYTGIVYAIPDRGWNTEGTLNYQNRIHTFHLTLTPQNNATTSNPSGPNINIQYASTMLLTGPDGTPLTGLDADSTGYISYTGYPDLPVATYTGNGFGGSGPGGKRIPVDSEGLVAMPDGTFWVSDEYGPYIYRFSAQGRMIGAIRPPDALIPMRNGSESFSADSPAVYQNETDDVNPTDPTSGRENNHGFEGLTISTDGKSLYVLLQEAATQEGGTSGSSENNVRFLQYDISNASAPVYAAEYVVPLPLYTTSKTHTAGASEVHYISATQFLVLSRDSGAGHGQSDSMSVYRHADVFDISKATNIKGSTYDCANCSVTTKTTGNKLKSGITPAMYCSFLDYNVNSQLERFGVYNGGNQSVDLLNEKWESLALVPVNDGSDGEFFLFSFSDNDFITQNGHMNFGNYPYTDSSGYNLDNQALAFQVKLPASPST